MDAGNPYCFIPILSGGIQLRLDGHAQVVVGVNSAGAPVPLKVANDGSLVFTPPTSQRTPTISLVTTSGSVAAGARALSFALSSDFTGTILGANFTGAFAGANLAAVTIPVPPGDTIGQVDYTVTAGSMLIIKTL